VIVDERDRISRDLHDSVIQMIYAVTLSLDDVPELVVERPAEAGRRVDEAIDALHGVIRDIRHFIFGLRPLLLDSGSLLDGLHALADELHRNTTTEITIVGEEPPDLPLGVVADLLAIGREALANVVRHAGATHAWIRLVSSPGAMTLEVIDDGRGIGPAAGAQRGHHGLANMRARAEALGGTFEVDDRGGAGTRVLVTIPVSNVRTGVER
jgi:signal transduction histidine kinase